MRARELAAGAVRPYLSLPSPARTGLASLTLAALLLGSCAGLKPAPSPYEGFWRTEGYGYLIEIEGRSVHFYEDSAAAIVPSFSGKLAGDRLSASLGPFGSIEGRLSLEGEALSLAFDGAARRLARRTPDFRADPRLAAGRDRGNAAVFDALWSAFDEHYVFFGLRGVDWNAAKEEYRPRALAARSSRELFGVLSELLAPLRDGHVSLHGGPGLEFEAAPPPAWAGSAQAFVDTIKTRYLAAPIVKRAGGLLASGRLRDGGVAGGVGYLAILGMEGFAEGGYAAEAAALEEALDAALGELEGAEALAIDLRFNGGGHDGHSLAILSRFVAERTLVWTKEARSGRGWTPRASQQVEPSPGKRWTKPIYVLTSGLTASAAETFALGLSARPEVVFVGERSAGIFSDMLPRRLPNGWIATLSNERYQGPDGSCPEGLGVRPGVEAPMDSALAAAGRDPALDAVLRLEAARRGGARP